jgi:hypothetical protein
MFRCPNCINKRANPSRRRWFEWPLLLLLLRPYRCAHCSRRFLRFVWQE